MTAFAVSPYQNRTLWLAVGLSILIHLALIGTSLLDLAALWPRPRPAPPPVIELVTLPEPEPPAPPPPAPVPTPATPLILAPPPPQLEEAPIAPESRHAGEAPQPAAPAAPPEPAPRAAAPPATPPAPMVQRPRRRQPSQADVAEAGAGLPLPQRIDAPTLLDRGQAGIGVTPRRGGGAEARQQSEGDFVLAQIMPHWLIDVRSPRFRDVVLGGTSTCRPTAR